MLCTSGLLIFQSRQLALLAAVVLNVAFLLYYREADPFYNHATNDLQFVCDLFSERIWSTLRKTQVILKFMAINQPSLTN